VAASLIVERDLGRGCDESEIERRALISKKPTPMRWCDQTGKRIALTHSP